MCEYMIYEDVKGVSMNANEVDVGDEVVISRGDWAGQTGKVSGKYQFPPDGDNPPKSLLTIYLVNFGRTIQKNNLDVEKIAHAP